MKRNTLSLLLVFLLLSTHAPLAFAQQSTSQNKWSDVQQLPTNERLVVKQKSGKNSKD